jgi:hypothetical protein
MNTDDCNLKQFNQNVLEYLKEKSLVNVEDFKEAFLQFFCNSFSPLIKIQSEVDPELSNEQT